LEGEVILDDLYDSIDVSTKMVVLQVAAHIAAPDSRPLAAMRRLCRSEATKTALG
jgi:hypothetical protein